MVGMCSQKSLCNGSSSSRLQYKQQHQVSGLWQSHWASELGWLAHFVFLSQGRRGARTAQGTRMPAILSDTGFALISGGVSSVPSRGR